MAIKYYQDRYKSRRDSGICVQCGVIRTQKVRCLKCRAKRVVSYKPPTTAERINESLNRRVHIRDLRIKRMLSLAGYLDRVGKQLGRVA